MGETGGITETTGEVPLDLLPIREAYHQDPKEKSPVTRINLQEMTKKFPDDSNQSITVNQIAGLESDERYIKSGVVESNDSLDSDIENAFDNYRQDMVEETKAPQPLPSDNRVLERPTIPINPMRSPA